jgi:hypothetical protein
MVKCGVLFEVRTELLNKMQTSFVFKGLNLNSVNQLIFVMVRCGVLFEVRTELLNKMQTSFVFKGLNSVPVGLPQHGETSGQEAANISHVLTGRS